MLKTRRFERIFVTLGLLLAIALPAKAQQPKVSITDAKYGPFPALRMSDGRSEALIVPAIGRVMEYRLVGGRSVMWAPDVDRLSQSQGFRNWGGDKTFTGPHPSWKQFAKSQWPPQPSWDGQEHAVEIVDRDGDCPRVKMTGGVWAGFGTRIVREFSFAADGDLIIHHAIEKIEGDGLKTCVWNVTQVATPLAIFVPLNPDSPYENAFAWAGGKGRPGADIERISPRMLRIRPNTKAGYKILIDARPSQLTAVYADVAFTTSTERLAEGEYSEAEEGKPGFAVEVYNHGDARGPYNELELLSPLKTIKPGEKVELTTHWRLTPLANGSADDPPDFLRSPADADRPRGE